MMRYLILFFAVLSLHAAGQQVILSGKITDSQGNPIAFASLYIQGTTIGTSANEYGQYQIRLKPGKYGIDFRSVGFKQQTEQVELVADSFAHNVELTYEDYQLKQTAGQGEEDPAFEIIRNVIKKRQYHLTEINQYACDVYIRGIQKLISAPKGRLIRGVAHELQLNLDNNSILYMSESESRFNFQQPNNFKEVMMSSKVTGNYNAFDFNRAAKLQLNFYRNMLDIEGLNPRGFVSPIADNAMKYYTYKLLGSTVESGQVIDKIQVIPLDDRDPIFKGNIYIMENDWRVYKAHLYVTNRSNLNFVDTLNINQQYIPVNDGKWQPASVSFTYSGNVLGFRYKGYILGNYSNYDLAPQFPPHYFNGETMLITQQTTKKDSVYWRKKRPVPLTPQEQQNYNLKDSILKKHETAAYLDSTERANNKFSPASYAFFGDTVKHRYKNEVLTLNPLYETIIYNTVEGWAVDLKPTYTKKFGFGRQYTISPEVRYGFENKIFSINTGFNYAYDPTNQGVFYGRVGTGIVDLNSEGSVGIFLNGLSSLFFKDNFLKLYRSKYLMAGMQREVARGLLLDGSMEYARRNALQNTSNRTVWKFPNKEYTSNNPLNSNLNAPLLFPESNALTFKISAIYTFDEEYTTRPEGRVYDQSKYPKIRLSYRKGIKNWLGSDVDYDYADIQVFHNHINLGMYGYSSFLITAGNFFNDKAVSYPDYKWFKGNQGITFTPGISQYHFLPYYTYSPASFFEAHYEHNFSGFLFNKIPGLRKLKLEEIVGGNYLTQKLNPAYTEFYIGVQRFFFRFDYGFVYRGAGHFDQGIKLYYGI
ncbi:DUF5686 and carboxypeptidase regulatory-like domain-containing protein [Mucilaginibacter paludis]|nr:DUF5686 and carboxypeptidase regulatory-like domain-containing protein [Mucilaginibacter paludis]